MFFCLFVLLLLLWFFFFFFFLGGGGGGGVDLVVVSFGYWYLYLLLRCQIAGKEQNPERHILQYMSSLLSDQKRPVSIYMYN